MQFDYAEQQSIYAQPIVMGSRLLGIIGVST